MVKHQNVFEHFVGLVLKAYITKTTNHISDKPKQYDCNTFSIKGNLLANTKPALNIHHDRDRSGRSTKFYHCQRNGSEQERRLCQGSGLKQSMYRSFLRLTATQKNIR